MVSGPEGFELGRWPTPSPPHDPSRALPPEGVGQPFWGGLQGGFGMAVLPTVRGVVRPLLHGRLGHAFSALYCPSRMLRKGYALQFDHLAPPFCGVLSMQLTSSGSPRTASSWECTWAASHTTWRCSRTIRSPIGPACGGRGLGVTASPYQRSGDGSGAESAPALFRQLGTRTCDGQVDPGGCHVSGPV